MRTSGIAGVPARRDCRNQADVCFSACQRRFEIEHSLQRGSIGKNLRQRFGGRQALD